MILALAMAPSTGGKPFSFPSVTLSCAASAPNVPAFLLAIGAAGSTDNHLTISRIGAGRWPERDIALPNAIRADDANTGQDGLTQAYVAEGKSNSVRYKVNFAFVRAAKRDATFWVTVSITGPKETVSAKCIVTKEAPNPKANGPTAGPDELV